MAATPSRSRSSPPPLPRSTWARTPARATCSIGCTASARALDGVSLTIGAGECFGLIGANGAGKTTTMRILATLLEPAGGHATIAGHDVVSGYLAVRRLIGYMPEMFSVYPELTVEEFLDCTAAGYGIRGSERKGRVHWVISFTGLGGRRTAAPDTPGRAMTTRLFA